MTAAVNGAPAVRDQPMDWAISERAAYRIVAKRRALGWSQGRLASECAERGLTMSREALANLETGRRRDGVHRRRMITFDEIAVIASALGVHPASLTNEDGASPLGVVDEVLVRAAEVAATALGTYVGDSVAVVLMDHSQDEYPDPNIHELAHVVLTLAQLGGERA